MVKDIKKIGKIIDDFFYGDKETREKILLDHLITICQIDEDDNHEYMVSISDSLFLINIDGIDFLVDIPWNKFWPYNEDLPDSVYYWYNF